MGQPKKCEHNKRKDTCKECYKNGTGGAGLCEHLRPKCRCKDCGTGYCKHKIRIGLCKECGGQNLCEHGNSKSRCKECGTGYCEHELRKDNCDICTPNRKCEHNRLKARCKDCNGSQSCEHKNERYKCKICNPSYVPTKCIHGLQKEFCIDCGGSYICKINNCNNVAHNKSKICRKHKKELEFGKEMLDCIKNNDKHKFEIITIFKYTEFIDGIEKAFKNDPRINWSNINNWSLILINNKHNKYWHPIWNKDLYKIEK